MSFLEARIARALDFGMCVMMNGVQFRHRLRISSRRELECYIAECEPLTREQFFAVPSQEVAPHAPQLASAKANGATVLQWQSPIGTPFAENNAVHVNLFPCEQGWRAPTVLMLHALMSASDVGYKLWAKRFNERGWNACFIHLPYHYSRRPRGYLNGELAISADLVRTAEGLRQAVIELRQLMQSVRELGSKEFGLWATSYGGWVGALLLSVESDFRFASLMAPIVNIEHAIWASPAATRLRGELRRNGITPELVERHFHLTSPMHSEPLCGNERVVFAAGEYDQIALPEDIVRLHEKWRGSELLRVAQGHFGYRMMREMFAHLVQRGFL